MYINKIYIFFLYIIFLVINSQLFLLYNFSKFLYIFTLFIHPSTLNITNKTPHSPDDGSAEPKRYSVDWLCFSINPYFLFRLLVVNFSSQIVGLLSIIFFHIYVCVCACVCGRAISLMNTVFANSPEDQGSILGRVIPKTQKMLRLFFTLSTIRWRSRVKWSNPGNGVAPSPIPRCGSYRKGSLRVTLD